MAIAVAVDIVCVGAIGGTTAPGIFVALFCGCAAGGVCKPIVDFSLNSHFTPLNIRSCNSSVYIFVFFLDFSNILL
jgi:hypothetical protein